MGACLAHGEVAHGEHIDHRTSVFRCITVGFQTHCLESGSTAVRFQGLDGRAFCSFIFGFEDTLAQFTLDFLVEIRELVHADEVLLTLGDSEVASLGGSFNGCLHEAFLQGFHISALFLHFEEEFPSRLGNVLGQFLDVVGTACHVHYLGKVGLFFQQQLLVACHALRQFGRRTLEGVVERVYRKGIHAAQYGRHGLGLGTQHIYVRIVHRLVPFGGLRMDVHHTFAVAAGVVSLHDVCPQIACGAQFGNFHEILGTGGEVETHFRSHFVDVHTGIRQFVQVFHAGSEGESQFLHDGGTGVVEYVSAHFHDFEVLVGSHLFHIGFHHIERLVVASLSFAGEGSHRVDVDTAVYLFGSDAPLFHHRLKSIQHGSFLASGNEVDFHALQADVLQQSVHVRFGKLSASVQHEAQGVHSPVEYVKRLLVGFGHILHHNVLAYVPVVVVLFVSPNERKFTRKTTQILQVFHILQPVHRLNIETFIGSPHKLFVKIGPFQVHSDFVNPLLHSVRRKLTEKLTILFFCHN